MTELEALDRTIELWTWLAETGSECKDDWGGWDYNDGKYDEADHDCFLCEYGGRSGCRKCPYFEKFSFCDAPEQPFKEWLNAATPEDRKKYAKKFLEQVKSLKEDYNGN